MSWQETPRHSRHGSEHFKPCLRHGHVIVLHLVLQPQRTTLSKFVGAGASLIVTGIILHL